MICGEEIFVALQLLGLAKIALATPVEVVMAHTSKPSVLALLRETYGAVNIPAVKAGQEIGLAEKTTRNMLSEGRFPLPTRKVSCKRVVSIFCLAEYLESGETISVSTEPPKRGRGRPTKAATMHAAKQRGAK